MKMTLLAYHGKYNPPQYVAEVKCLDLFNYDDAIRRMSSNDKEFDVSKGAHPELVN